MIAGKEAFCIPGESRSPCLRIVPRNPLFRSRDSQEQAGRDRESRRQHKVGRERDSHLLSAERVPPFFAK